MKLRRAHRLALVPAASLLLLAACSKSDDTTSTNSTTTATPSGSGSSTTAKSPGTTTKGTTPKTPGSTPGSTPGTTPGGTALALVAATPDGLADPMGDWGDQTVVAVPKPGKPVIAFTRLDLNGDGQDTDDEVLFSSYDPSDSSWSEPTSILKGDFQSTTEAPAIAMAADASTGAIAIAYLNYDNAGDSGDAKGVKLAWSSDGGKTFASKAFGETDGSTSGPAIAVRDGKVVVTYSASDGVHVLTGTSAGGKAPTSLKDEVAPGIGDDKPSALPSAVTIDEKGKAFVSYHLDPGSDYNRQFVVWAVGSAAPVKVFDSAGKQNDSAHTGLAARDGALVAGSTLVAEGASDDRVARVSVSTDGGATWSSPAGVVGDGATAPRSMALGAFDGGGALFAYNPNSGGDTQECYTPKVAVSKDDKTWVPCVSPSGDPQLDANVYPGVATEADGTAWIVFTNLNAEGAPAGVLVWHTSKDKLTGGGKITG